ncbi:CehA/McbA family metallohydrolase [Thermotoga profunda]|uniref:CehA/McbA family metallohydrolase n=1 Tax=Thermotoga profunda TaxID=1508420 RepID=UPI0006932528|nr:CehA/McbA family metallohydrolase [Thermotoga profunda]
MRKSLTILFLFSCLAVFSYNFYFANIHAHTNFSDGQGTPTQAYEYAKDYVDVQGVTDHAYYFRQTINGMDKLLLTESIARQSTKDGEFVALWGFEWTGGVGHINVYGTRNWTDRNESDLKNLYKWIVQNKALAQFNHPGVTYGNFYDFDYDLEADQYINLIEVGNGNTTNRTITKEMYLNYKLALDKGWHVGATANQDNHRPNWGSANDTRTVILADSLTYESIMDALKNRRVYASEDKDAKVIFKCNDQWMGSILKDATQLLFEIQLQDDEPFYEVTLVSQSGDVKTWRINSNEFKMQYTCEPSDGYEWYFLYVIQRDWDEIITAPIWIQRGDVYVVNLRANPQQNGVEVYFDLINSSYESTQCDLQVYVANQSQTLQVSTDPRTKKELRFSFKDIPVGVQNITITLNGHKAQTALVEIKENFITIDQSHENKYQDFWKSVEEYLKENGFQVRYSSTYLKKVPITPCLFLALPKKGGFPESMALNDFEIDNLVLYYQSGGKIVFVALPDSIVEESYNRLLEKLLSGAKFVQKDRILLQVNDLLFDRYIKDSIFFISCENPDELLKFVGGRL